MLAQTQQLTQAQQLAQALVCGGRHPQRLVSSTPLLSVASVALSALRQRHLVHSRGQPVPQIPTAQAPVTAALPVLLAPHVVAANPSQSRRLRASRFLLQTCCLGRRCPADPALRPLLGQRPLQLQPPQQLRRVWGRVRLLAPPSATLCLSFCKASPHRLLLPLQRVASDRLLRPRLLPAEAVAPFQTQPPLVSVALRRSTPLPELPVLAALQRQLARWRQHRCLLRAALPAAWEALSAFRISSARSVMTMRMMVKTIMITTPQTSQSAEWTFLTTQMWFLEEMKQPVPVTGRPSAATARQLNSSDLGSRQSCRRKVYCTIFDEIPLASNFKQNCRIIQCIFDLKMFS